MSRKPDPSTQVLIDRLRAMKPNESFFVEGATLADMASFRQLCRYHEITVSISIVNKDSVHGKPGARVFKREEEL